VREGGREASYPSRISSHRPRRLHPDRDGGTHRFGAVVSGTFANEWITEYRCGMPHFKELRKEGENHPIEKFGAKLRAMMPWLASDRLVDKRKN
jgi:hypothetical protein